MASDVKERNRAILFSALLATLLLSGCKFSPHGGIVPIWQNTGDPIKYRGGNGLSLQAAVRIEHAYMSAAEVDELIWLWQHKYKLNGDQYVATRKEINGRLYDIVELPGPLPRKPIYFDITALTDK